MVKECPKNNNELISARTIGGVLVFFGTLTLVVCYVEGPAHKSVFGSDVLADWLFLTYAAFTLVTGVMFWVNWKYARVMLVLLGVLISVIFVGMATPLYYKALTGVACWGGILWAFWRIGQLEAE